MKHLKYYPLFSLFLLMISCSSSEFEIKVIDSVNRQLDTYPESRLQDLYKNFFQDRFGPGHLIRDLSAAENYLRQELNSYTESHGPLTELIGWEGNYYRVNLDIVKEKYIPYEMFLAAFVESANSAETPSLEEWQKEWDKILLIIDKMSLNLPDYEEDKAAIQELLDNGEYIVHHSNAFNKAYDPHYRIVHKEIFKDKIAPSIE